MTGVSGFSIGMKTTQKTKKQKQKLMQRQSSFFPDIKIACFVYIHNYTVYGVLMTNVKISKKMCFITTNGCLKALMDKIIMSVISTATTDTDT